MLPCTSVAGGHSVANDVRQAFTELEPPLCEVYCYPSDAPDNRPDTATASSSVKGRTPRPAAPALAVEPMTTLKRGLDVFGAAIALTMLAPLLWCWSPWPSN